MTHKSILELFQDVCACNHTRPLHIQGAGGCLQKCQCIKFREREAWLKHKKLIRKTFPSNRYKTYSYKHKKEDEYDF